MLLRWNECPFAQGLAVIRVDMNVPVRGDEILDDARLHQTARTVQAFFDRGIRVALLSHWGRPRTVDSALSLKAQADWLSAYFQKPVFFQSDWSIPPRPQDVLTVYENLRFSSGEQSNSLEFAQTLTKLAPVYVFDAFSVSHRQHASTHQAILQAPLACAGPLFLEELDRLTITNTPSPRLAIVGGSKLDTKIKLLEGLLEVVDVLFVGGALAFPLMAAADCNLQLPVRSEYLWMAKQLLQFAKTHQKHIFWPRDFIKAVSLDALDGQPALPHEIRAEEFAVDIGPSTVQQLKQLIDAHQSILWNGPMGYYENPAFATGSLALAHCLGQSGRYTMAGGGDTVALLKAAGTLNDLSVVSTAGGAFLSYLEDPEALCSLRALLDRH